MSNKRKKQQHSNNNNKEAAVELVSTNKLDRNLFTIISGSTTIEKDKENTIINEPRPKPHKT